jgi:hypothetical protein
MRQVNNSIILNYFVLQPYVLLEYSLHFDDLYNNSQNANTIIEKMVNNDVF